MMDVAVFVVSATKVADAVDIEFVQTHLDEKCSYLVFTNVDKVDPEEFALCKQSFITACKTQAGLDFQWQGVFVYRHDLNTPCPPEISREIELQSWWVQQGQEITDSAHDYRIREAWQRWQNEANAFTNKTISDIQHELDSVEKRSSIANSITEAHSIRCSIRSEIEAMPHDALRRYRHELQQTRNRLVSIPLLGHVRSLGANIDNPDLRATLGAYINELLSTWTNCAKEVVRTELKQRINDLVLAIDTFAELVDKVCQQENSTDTNNAASSSAPIVSTKSTQIDVPDITLTLAELVRPSLTATVSGAGSALVVNSVLTWIFGAGGPIGWAAAGVGLAMAKVVKTVFQNQNTQKLRDEYMRSFVSMLAEEEGHLLSDYRSDWTYYIEQFNQTLRPIDNKLKNRPAFDTNCESHTAIAQLESRLSTLQSCRLRLQQIATDTN
jgi:hypothetical protein